MYTQKNPDHNEAQRWEKVLIFLKHDKIAKQEDVHIYIY